MVGGFLGPHADGRLASACLNSVNGRGFEEVGFGRVAFHVETAFIGVGASGAVVVQERSGGTVGAVGGTLAAGRDTSWGGATRRTLTTALDDSADGGTFKEHFS